MQEELDDAPFFFNLIYGRKVIPLYLLIMAFGVGGVPHYIDRQQTVLEINIPMMRAEEIASNPNYYAILKVVLDNTGAENILCAIRMPLMTSQRYMYLKIREREG